MQVEMSLGELLINAIAAGRIPGVQFKRGWSKERETFEALKQVIANRLDGARHVAIQDALHKLQDEHPHFRTRHENMVLRAALGEVVHEADLMLRGGEAACQDAEQCPECGVGGVGLLRDALHKARPLVIRGAAKEET